MSSSSSISSSVRLFTARIPTSLFTTKTLSASPTPKNPSFFRPISFQRIPASKPPPTAASPSPSTSSSISLQPIEELPPKLQEIVKLFQSVQEPKAKYEQLLFYGKNLKTLDSQYKTKQNKVEGCVSQVWVRSYLDSDRNVVFEADSDSVLTKGLAALLVNGLSGLPVEEVLRVSPDFVVLLGLQQSLTPSRNNGFLNMLKLMQKKALQLLVEAESGTEGVESPNPGLNSARPNSGSETNNNVGSSNFGLNSELGVEEKSNVESKTQGGSNLGDLGSRGKRIKEILEKELRPIELQVEDISYQHAGHAGVRGTDGETHFTLKVVSKEFEGKSSVKRHRLIYGLLQEELQSGLHALSIVAKTPSEV
ncbi:sufE-like protein 1, chloroplastic/mitochondrial [Ziziphus jujuba]|uniref:SufE-like protein 1, chloroplastic/mitochondrial n=1 Tax=Ziziphus jujuba TaxID=326968 RepID=A0ABM3IV44_ZIZJJ|nr:sufE-like protein 1, chloroplastic/mitochondrial [Ziziphus jujuba]